MVPYLSVCRLLLRFGYHLAEMAVMGRQGKNQEQAVGQPDTTTPKDQKGWPSRQLSTLSVDTQWTPATCQVLVTKKALSMLSDTLISKVW